MDDVIRTVYGFERNTIGYRYVRACMKRKKILHPWKFLSTYEPTKVKCSTSGHLGRASSMLEEFHPDYKFYY